MTNIEDESKQEEKAKQPANIRQSTSKAEQLQTSSQGTSDRKFLFISIELSFY